jgi:hypothetical protein
MNTSVDLTPEQKQFLAHACAFIATNPPRHEIDQLLTLGAMLLPEPVAQMLAKRAGTVGSSGMDAPLRPAGGSSRAAQAGSGPKRPRFRPQPISAPDHAHHFQDVLRCGRVAVTLLSLREYTQWQLVQ